MARLKDIYNSKNNNLLLLRLLCATFVVFCHSWDLLKVDNPLATILHFLPFTSNLGVLCFFVISGFLITESYVKNNQVIYFIKARILRILPGFIASLIVTALIIGSLATTLPLKDYLSLPQVYSYIYHNMMLSRLQLELPGVFASNPLPGAVNGSLWTLVIEIRLYVITLLIGIVGGFKKRYTALLVSALLFVPFTYYFYHRHGPIFAEPIFFYIAGSLFYIFKDKIIINFFYALLGVGMFILCPYPVQFAIAVVVFTYCVMIIAFKRKLSLPFLDKCGDFSYGIYIYAFPIQQLIINLNPKIMPVQLFLISFLLSLLAAIGSWFLIEKPALALKNLKFNYFKPAKI
ncbi:acyltransferase [Legionella beliardensis]|uniref:Acyltransferase n=1 Tax=Legionella beliardensis TaxID=91822 RepID=A0A378HZA7_9GAMM|nr:acyltransferase [Legionella beliardensis]STX27705.1 acyltransferase [Legionella beliardensis]